MSDQVLVYPDPRLRQKAKPVEEVTPEIRRRALELLDTLRRTDGIGLAAPQVGWGVRIFAYDLSLYPGVNQPGHVGHVLVNPVVTTRSSDVWTADEGCLSLPGIHAKVERTRTISIEATDIWGNPHNLTPTNLLARLFLHELDHLDGVLFIDRLTPARRVAVKRKLRKLEEG